MCLYHYLYFSSCQHGEFTQITYCNKAKALGLAERDNLLQRSVGAAIDYDSQPYNSTSLSRPPTSSSANNHSASHSHNQQQHQHRSMATLSPSKARMTLGCGPIQVNQGRHSPQRAALIPRSALPETGLRDSSHNSAHTTSTSVMQVTQALNSDNTRGSALMLSTGDFNQGSHHEVASMTSSSAHHTCDSDMETVQGSSETSVDIITERDIISYDNVKSASPRKPLPAQWLPPPSSPILATVQRAGGYDGMKGSSGSFPVERKTVRATRSSLDIGNTHADRAFFLTKEALDAVDSNITSPTLRRSPSKIQRSPTKVPWNSPTVSPKVGSLRQSAESPTKPSSPRTTHLGTHVIANHRRAPSSIVSTGATSFHTANASPVRSPAFSQTSFSSAGDFTYTPPSDYLLDAVTNSSTEQNDDSSSRPKASTVRATTNRRTQDSRPELSISIPPPGSAPNAESKSTSTLVSATSSSGASIGIGNTPVSPTQSSRIPRMSISKGSSARAPTLSSTLKQMKSTQTLRLPKTMKETAASTRAATSKAGEARSIRHVCTIDSTGATPILSDRKSREFSIPASVASVATAATGPTTHPGDVDSLTSYLQDTALDASRVLGLFHGDSASSTTPRATSTSTVRAPQASTDPVSADLTVNYSPRKPKDPGMFNATPRSLRESLTPVKAGNVHSSDADDEDDDSTTSAAPGSGDGLHNSSPIRGRSAQYSPRLRQATASDMSTRSSLASDLRATATEFVPSCQDTPATDVPNNPPAQVPVLPDMYALDAYGIPWFYHMYPVPWMFPPIYAKGRSKSPKKFRPKKQRSIMTSQVNAQQGQHEVLPSVESSAMASAGGSREYFRAHEETTHLQQSITGSGDVSGPGTATNVKPSDGPFSTQFDIVARQAALQTSTNTIRHPEIDLTTIRNVPIQDVSHQGLMQGYNTVPSRRHNQRHNGNGLYGGRGNVGVPLYATVPFPNPVPPMGRPTERYSSDHKAYVGYTVGTRACGTIEIERAAEHGGGDACNTCEPDH